MRFDRPVLLYGAGKEARSTRAFLASHYPQVAVDVTVDSGEADLPATTQVAPDALDLARYGTIVKSPGVSRYRPIFAQARARGITVTSNLNIWADHHRAGKTVIAISGTKGKSTTATLLHLMLTHSGVPALLAGNVGVAPLDVGDSDAVIVFELSSYQTADMQCVPDIAGLTNLYPEHVDWHGTVEQYYADKLRLLAGPGLAYALGEVATDDPAIRAATAPDASPLPPLDPVFRNTLGETAQDTQLKGEHNRANARLAARLALAAGASEAGILEGVRAFAPLPHRLAAFTLGGLTVVDDSIATTPEATKAALSAYAGQAIALIGGGHEREQDYTDIAKKLAPSGVRVLVALPVTGARFAQATRQHAPDVVVIEAPTLDDAMMALAGERDRFDTLILSPGAPSYNQFKNFEERGDRFTALAIALFGEDENP